MERKIFKDIEQFSTEKHVHVPVFTSEVAADLRVFATIELGVHVCLDLGCHAI